MGVKVQEHPIEQFCCPPRGAASFRTLEQPEESGPFCGAGGTVAAHLAQLRAHRGEDLFAEAHRAPALAALLGLRSEDLLVDGPPVADFSRLGSWSLDLPRGQL